MKPCPQIAAFQAISGPTVVKWIAKFVISIPATKGSAGYLDFLPTDFYGSTEERAVNQAREWWAAEQAKIEDRKAEAKAKAEGRKSKRAGARA